MFEDRPYGFGSYIQNMQSSAKSLPKKRLLQDLHKP